MPGGPFNRGGSAVDVLIAHLALFAINIATLHSGDDAVSIVRLFASASSRLLPLAWPGQPVSGFFV